MSLRVVVLGSGQAAGIHSKALRAVAPQAKRYYASRDGARAAAAASTFGGAGSFVGYDAAIDSPEIDAVIIGLPPAMHLEWTLRALAAGKHVVVEKPPFLASADFDQVEAAARSAGRQVMVAENYFYKPLRDVLQSAITSGDLGRVLFIQLTALKRQTTGDWRDEQSLSGGGALFEGGIHWISLLANIGLTPARVRATFPDHPSPAAPAPPALETVASPERSALVTIDYVEGAVTTLAYSWDVPGRINGVRMSRVYGTGGVLRFETNGIFVAQGGRRKRLSFPGLSDLAGYRAMWRDFVAAIEENRPPRYDVGLARRDLTLVEQAYASQQRTQTSR